MKPSEFIRQRFANSPAGWIESEEGRRLRAKSLRHVRKVEGRKVAKRLNDEIYVFTAIPMP